MKHTRIILIQSMLLVMLVNQVPVFMVTAVLPIQATDVSVSMVIRELIAKVGKNYAYVIRSAMT